jgi:hypothetical protein
MKQSHYRAYIYIGKEVLECHDTTLVASRSEILNLTQRCTDTELFKNDSDTF